MRLLSGNQLTSIAVNSALGLSGFILSLSLSWAILYVLDFNYGFWHDHGGIEEGIEKYGPKNRFKEGFGDTDYEQRIDLFHKINVAVHSGGQGLAAISYESKTSDGPQKLLRQAEIIHLVDVANLIDSLRKFAIVNAFFWLLLVVLSCWRNATQPNFRYQLFGLVSVLMIAGVILVAVGPVDVFNQIHIWVFPKDNQWFFYYQDSLMSTMMLAPVLFGWIGIVLAALACVFFLLITLLVSFLARFFRSKASL